MDFLEVLNLKSENKGVSTGANWLSSKGEVLHSYSPVDGNLIGSVLTTDKESYEKTIETAQTGIPSVGE
jgi:aldehyde dehydrogenase (NAD+)